MSLVNKSENLISESQNLIYWLDNNDLKLEHNTKRKIHRLKEQAKKLRNAASSNMTLGIFGESQSGKSYLVEEMAKNPENKKWAKKIFDDSKNYYHYVSKNTINKFFK